MTIAAGHFNLSKTSLIGQNKHQRSISSDGCKVKLTRCTLRELSAPQIFQLSEVSVY